MSDDVMPLADLLANYVPGSQDQPWTWDDEERDILTRECLCCGQPGHYQLALERHIAAHGLTGLGVCLGTDGRVWDGHHRIVAARRLGIDAIPLESALDAEERFDRDHGSRVVTPEDRRRAVARDLLAHRSPLTITPGMREALRKPRPGLWSWRNLTSPGRFLRSRRSRGSFRGVKVER